MDEINLIDYCVIGLGKIETIKKDLSYVAENNFNVVYGDGLLIGTFKSALNIMEIEDILKKNKLSYIIFEINIGFFSVSLENKSLEEKIFGSYLSQLPLLKMREEMLKSVFGKKSNEELLEEAIENEDYETAAELRDKIKNEK